MSRWFISLAKSSPFVAAVWGASDDIGYSAYHVFLVQKGKSSSLTTVAAPSQPKGGQSAGQSAGQASSKIKAKSEVKTVRTEVRSAQHVSFNGGLPLLEGISPL